MTAPELITVEIRGTRQRLDRYLASLERFGSRAAVQRLIAAGQVLLEGRAASADDLLKPGMTISVTATAPPADPSIARPEEIPLVILHEDPWLIVIDKPAGLVVHPATGNWRGTLVNALLYHWGGALPGLDERRPGVVHRLDKDTSGVLVVAKDPDTQWRLTEQFRAREVHKEYLAFVWGRPRPASGCIDQPIGRHPVERKRMAIHAKGRAAVTRYEVVESGPKISLLQVRPETGRTHQIRVHLASLGHPIVADRVYGKAPSAAVPTGLARQALHAHTLSFLHPASGEQVRFTAPLPADLRALREALHSDLT